MATAMATDQEQRQWQWGNDWSLPLQSIAWGRGAPAWASFIPCVLFRRVSEWLREVRIDEWCTCLTAWTIIYSE
jgi:hypothetical protein